MSEFTQNGTQPYDQLVEKWNPVLNHDSFDKIGDSYKKKVTAVLLENQEIAMKQQYLAEAPTNSMGGGFSVTQAANQAGSIAGYDPVLISLIRRSMPNLMAYDICGVQPMSAPTGLIFAMKSKYDSQGSSQEALFQEAFAKFSGKGGTTAGAAENAGSGVTFVGDTPGVTLTAGEFARAAVFGTDFQGISAANAEGLGGAGGSFNQMAFSIERVAVEARTRALKAEYSTELAQDLKAVHGLDAETELANILSTEILTEINREIIRNVYFNAEIGCTQTDLAGAGATDGPVSGMYDLAVDSDGRWSAERFRGLMFQIERECNQIAKETLEMYAPIALRLGMNNVRIEFENLGFTAMHPRRAERISAALNKARGNRKELVDTIRQQIETTLEAEGHVAEALGREKHLYSIYKKMKSKRKSFSEIMDIYAFRIVVDSVDTCYRVLGSIHSLYKPVPGEFKDYIAIP